MNIIKAVLALCLTTNFMIPPLIGQELNRLPPAQLDKCLDGKLARFINDFRKAENGSNFLKSHTEEGLRKSILFLQYPEDYFEAIQCIPDLCANIWAIQLFFFDLRDGDHESGFRDFFRFLRDNYDKADARNVRILTYLILSCVTGALSESLVDRYTRLFEFQYDLFVDDLRQRSNWRDVVSTVVTGDWRAFSAGLAKLGNSPFEVELKEYVASLIRGGASL